MSSSSQSKHATCTVCQCLTSHLVAVVRGWWWGRGTELSRNDAALLAFCVLSAQRVPKGYSKGAQRVLEGCSRVPKGCPKGAPSSVISNDAAVGRILCCRRPHPVRPLVAPSYPIRVHQRRHPPPVPAVPEAALVVPSPDCCWILLGFVARPPRYRVRSSLRLPLPGSLLLE